MATHSFAAVIICFAYIRRNEIAIRVDGQCDMLAIPCGKCISMLYECWDQSSYSMRIVFGSSTTI